MLDLTAEERHELTVRQVAGHLNDEMIDRLVHLAETGETSWAHANDFIRVIIRESVDRYKRDRIGAPNGQAAPGDRVQRWVTGAERSEVMRVVAGPHDGAPGFLLVTDSGDTLISDLGTGWHFI